MSDKQTLIYWVDLTGPAPLDEIVRLTIVDINNNILFNHNFNTKLVDWWYSDLNGIKPEETFNQQQFENYKNKIQSIFNRASRLITFDSSTFFLEKQGINLSKKKIDDLADPFRVAGDATDTIDNLCIYYGYDLPTNIYNRTGLDYAKAINYCWREMERYKEAQENK